ncbi:MAG: hypothetical protein JKY92_05375 [Magnetovibrio sp.]|nr:hypothetical protein [Magnetovibrio sp.]
MVGLYKTFKIGGRITCVAALHATIILGYPEFAPMALAIGMGLILFAAVVWRDTRGEIITLSISFILFSSLSYIALMGDALATRIVVLPPLFINAWLAYFFGRTLFLGRDPLISHFSRISRGEIPKPLILYTRNVTWVWTSYFIFFTTIALFSAIYMSMESWTWLVNVGGPCSAVVLFLGEHAYRGVKYRHFGHNSPIRTLMILINPETWATYDLQAKATDRNTS